MLSVEFMLRFFCLKKKMLPGIERFNLGVFFNLLGECYKIANAIIANVTFVSFNEFVEIYLLLVRTHFTHNFTLSTFNWTKVCAGHYH